MYKYAVSLAAVACLATIPAVWAADDPEAIIVTASRSAETVDASLASVTVIDRKTIEQSQAQSLMELLQTQSVGLDIARSGGPGTSTTVFMRGTESDHILVLIDGVKASSATSGAFNWNSLSTQQIERIEIVRGPNSTLYGSAAIGGIIQIFTRQDTAPRLDFNAGSQASQSVSLGSGGKVGAGRFHFSASQQSSSGFSATNDKHSGFNPDADGYSQLSANAGLQLPLTGNANLRVNLMQSEGSVDYDDTTTPGLDASADSLNRAADLRLTVTSSDSWQQIINLGHSLDELETHDSFPATIATRRTLVGWQNDIQTGVAGLLVAGLEYEEERGHISGAYDERNYDRAAYAQYQHDTETLRWKIGLRHDDHSEYGDHNTGNLGLSLPLGRGRLLANYGTAFKAPSFNELFYPWYGNPNLKPEKSASLELGYRIAGLKASLFHTRVDDLIGYDLSLFQANNIDKATITGLELEYTRRWQRWSLRSGLTLQDPEDDETGKQLLRRAKEKLFIHTTHSLGEGSDATLEINYTGARDDQFGFPATPVELSAYTLVNLSTRVPLDPHWSLSARVENLLDEDYELIYGYNTPGRSAYLGLSYR